MRLCVVYVVKEVALFLVEGGVVFVLSQLMGIAREKTLALALQPLLQQQEERKKLESCYIETGTNSNLFYLKYIPKVLQDPLKGKESRQSK